MTDIESRLADLGDALDLDETDDLVTAVLARLKYPADDPTIDLAVDAADGTGQRPARRGMVWLRAAAALIVVAAAASLAIPTSRHAIAEWFGLDGVGIDREPQLSVPAEAPAVGDGQPLDGGTVVEVDGTDVLVGQFDAGALDGRLDEALISKTLAAGTGIERVDVSGNPGLWIDGEPHVVQYRSGDGEVVSERFAGNTLLWQDGGLIRRVEGFASLEEALAFATSSG